MIACHLFIAAEIARLNKELPEGWRANPLQSWPVRFNDDGTVEFSIVVDQVGEPWRMQVYLAKVDPTCIFSIHDAVAEVKKHFGLAAEQFKRELCKEPVG